MTIASGERIPSVTLWEMGPDGPQTVTTDALFKGRKVVLFAIPGAFTPTCSGRHLPGFIEHAEDFRARGVEEIVCVSVNDAFVMAAWGESHGAAGQVRLLADGNAEFARAVGLEVDLAGRGFGLRSQRYAMVVDDGVVTALAVDEPGVCDISSAQRMLDAL